MRHAFRIRALTVAICLTGVSVAAAASGPQNQPTPAAKPADDAAKKDEGAKKPEPPKEKPFAEIVKDAQVTPGLFTLYRTSEKVFLELKPDQLERMYVLSLTCESGLGERGFYAAAMCGTVPIVFHKEGPIVQMIGKNTRHLAVDNAPMSRAVARSFSDSILGSIKPESLPHPERKSVLIDLGAIFLTDLPMLSFGLESTYRIPYRFDAKNSAFGQLRGFERNTEFETIAHYAVERPPVPPLVAPGSTPPPQPPPPRTLVDVRSLLARFRYSLAELPQTGYRPRLADDRVGHFFAQRENYGTDISYSPTVRYISRWHLEKADPAAALSRPKQPIVFWLENTIPVKYRPAIRDGVLAWNKAFERAGFKDAIEVKEQPDTPDWDAGDIRYSTIRWIVTTDAGFAQGPSSVDPMTGQIFNADIRFAESMTRFWRREITELIGPATHNNPGIPMGFMAPWSTVPAHALCDYSSASVVDAEFTASVLEARGHGPDSPEADAFIEQYLREIAAHEVGHTLGLRHNFRASMIRKPAELHDADLTRKEGLTGSVMDYIATNIAAKGAKQGEYHQTTVGPYDVWAIEYAYKPVGASSPEAELPELRKIASRVAEPLLAFATDEDAGISGEPFDMDPGVNRFDLGADPLEFHRQRVQLAHEIVANLDTKLEKPGEGYQILRRSFAGAMNQMAASMRMTAKYIGGVYHYRDHVGDEAQRMPFQPVPAAKQREALKVLQTHLFAADAFRFPPKLLNKLASERFTNFIDFSANVTRFDYPVHAMVLSVQRSVLDRAFHPIVLNRVLDSEVKTDRPADVFRLSELFGGLQDAVWSETKESGALDIRSYRRALQREHLRKLVGMVLRDAAVPEDARTLARHFLGTLRRDLQRMLAAPGPTTPLETRAHLAESLARINETLNASAQRTAF